ncbi:MAG TPA: PASTA domain-containing protein [Gemmatimonadaceae bacterium]|nr:PASTA domain-containing protein [Gemmatimonadaceae bacterium]
MTPRIPWRTVRLYAFTALAGFISAWLIVAFFVLPGGRARNRIVTPDLAGMSLEEARHLLDSVGLRFSLGEERPSADVPRNGVLGQQPAAGRSVQRLTVVRVDVSAGPRQIRIPTVAGLTLEDARKVLSDSGLSAGGVQNEGSTAPRGEVLRTKPDAGRFVGEGAAVELIVSTGPPDLTMPDVIGRSPGDAVAVLNQLGISRVRVQGNDSTTAGLEMVVVSQQPAAGSGIRTTDRIVLRVSPRQ